MPRGWRRLAAASVGGGRISRLNIRFELRGGALRCSRMRRESVTKKAAPGRTLEAFMIRFIARITLLLAVVAMPALAQNYPTRQVTLIVPFAAPGPPPAMA